jgi:hypothetical protein
MRTITYLEETVSRMRSRSADGMPVYVGENVVELQPHPPREFRYSVRVGQQQGMAR